MCAQYREIDQESYVAVEVNRLLVGFSLPFDVFIKDHSLFIPLFNKGTVFDGEALNILSEKGISLVQIPIKAGIDLDNYLSPDKEPKKAPTNPEIYHQYVETKDKHYAIDRSLLHPGTRISFNLYVLNNFRLSTLLPATETAPALIDDRVVKTPGDIVIETNDVHRYQAYLDSLLSSGDLREKEKERVQHVAIKENSKLVLKDLLDNPRSGEKTRESIMLVNKMVDAILDHKDAVFDLLSLRSYDYYTYTHCVNVAVLSIALGSAVGMKRTEIEKLGIGAMLHDVGKSAIPVSIINKAGRLTDEEYRVIKTHVLEGVKILRSNEEIPEESFLAVTQHHERLSGKGYPHSTTGQDIHGFGRITSIVDCYDAMTTERSYQAARTPFFALSIITRETGDFDLEILKEFIKMLGTLKM